MARSRPADANHLENPMHETNTAETTYPALFPLSELKTSGYAQPEVRDEAEVEETEHDEPGAEAA